MFVLYRYGEGEGLVGGVDWVLKDEGDRRRWVRRRGKRG